MPSIHGRRFQTFLFSLSSTFWRLCLRCLQCLYTLGLITVIRQSAWELFFPSCVSDYDRKMRLRTFAKARAGRNGDFQPERPTQTQHLCVQSSAPFFILSSSAFSLLFNLPIVYRNETDRICSRLFCSFDRGVEIKLRGRMPPRTRSQTEPRKKV